MTIYQRQRAENVCAMDMSEGEPACDRGLQTSITWRKSLSRFVGPRKTQEPSIMAQELELRVREVSGSNFGLGTICNGRNCSVFSAPSPPLPAPRANFRTASQIRPRPFRSTSFPIHYLPNSLSWMLYNMTHWERREINRMSIRCTSHYCGLLPPPQRAQYCLVHNFYVTVTKMKIFEVCEFYFCEVTNVFF